MLPPKNRLKKTDFDALGRFKKRIFVSENFTLRTYDSGFKPSRFAVVVSSKVLKKAVERNKKRRQIKGVIIQNADNLLNGFAVIIYLKKEGAKTNFKMLNKELSGLFRKSDLLA